MVKKPPANAGDTKRCRFDTSVQKIPWRKAWQPTPGFLPGASHGQRNLAGYSPWSRKESDITEAIYHTCTQIPSTLGHSLYFQCLRGTKISFKSTLMGKVKGNPRGDRGTNPVKRKQTQRFLWTMGGCEAM